MARLFITKRELDFISDITKEVIKDVIGSKIYYYAISEIKTKVHDVYNEATQKVFDNPIAIDALVDKNFQSDTTINQFGVDAQYKIEAYIQHRDLIEKGIEVNIGDFFSFSDVFYEITERIAMGNIYGLAEHKDGIKIIGTRSRETQFKAPLIGPTDLMYSDADAVQQTFVQQRGMAENSEGPTGDVHDLVKVGILDPPLTGQREVSPKGDDTGTGSAFYDEEDN